MSVMYLYKCERWLYLHHIHFAAKIIKRFIRFFMGGVIPYQTVIGKGTFITYHGPGVVIHRDAVIGDNCIIRQNVTIAGGNGGVPHVGNCVEINAGAVLVGPIKIGNNVRIGANAVVNTDIQDNCTAVGIPAKPIKFYKPEEFKIYV